MYVGRRDTGADRDVDGAVGSDVLLDMYQSSIGHRQTSSSLTAGETGEGVFEDEMTDRSLLGPVVARRGATLGEGSGLSAEAVMIVLSSAPCQD